MSLQQLRARALSRTKEAIMRRQIVLDDGQVFHVTGSSITTDDPALIAHLDRHGDFERMSEGG